MSKLRVLIVEDELILAASLKATLQELGYEVPAMFTNAKETLEHFHQEFADIIIMDIHLRGNMNGVEISKAIREVSTAPVIFITNNKDDDLRRLAIFETNSVQYLSKPFTRNDLIIAMDLALKSIKVQQMQLKSAKAASHLMNDCIFLRDEHVFRKVMIADILLLKAEGAYCKLYYYNERGQVENMLFSENLSALEERLYFTDLFYRVHRSFVINVKHILKVQDNRLWVPGMEVPIGKTYKADLRSRLHFF